MGTQGVQLSSSSLLDELLEELLDELLDELLEELLDELLDELLEELLDEGKSGTLIDDSLSHATNTIVAHIKHININKNFFILFPFHRYVKIFFNR